MFDKEFHFFWSMVIFMAAYSLLLTAVSAAFVVQVNSSPYPNMPGFVPTSGYTYALVENDGNGGAQNGQNHFNVTSTPGAGLSFEFKVTSNSLQNVVFLINGFGQKYMYIYQSGAQLFFTTHKVREYTTLDLLAHLQTNGEILIFLDDYIAPYRMELIANAGITMQDALNSNSHYTVIVSQTDANYASNNAAGAQAGLLGLLTLSIPNMGFFLQLVIASPLYFGIAYFTFKFIHAFLPTMPDL